MAINPAWWIEIFQGLQDALDRWPPGRATFASRNGRLPDDRRTRVGMRLFGALMAAVATAHLYEEVARLIGR